MVVLVLMDKILHLIPWKLLVEAEVLHILGRLVETVAVEVVEVIVVDLAKQLLVKDMKVEFG